jgi:hypothetical protein
VLVSSHAAAAAAAARIMAAVVHAINRSCARRHSCPWTKQSVGANSNGTVPPAAVPIAIDFNCSSCTLHSAAGIAAASVLLLSSFIKLANGMQRILLLQQVRAQQWLLRVFSFVSLRGRSSSRVASAIL